MKTGFTLIEVLVVVLIIGVLASLALPQYRRAVIKSHASEAFSLCRSVSSAIELWGMANGNNWQSLIEDGDPFELLDISLKLEPYPLNPKLRRSKRFVYSLEANGDDVYIRAYHGRKPGEGDFDLAYHTAEQYWSCTERSVDGRKLCLSYGGTPLTGANYKLAL